MRIARVNEVSASELSLSADIVWCGGVSFNAALLTIKAAIGGPLSTNRPLLLVASQQ